MKIARHLKRNKGKWNVLDRVFVYNFPIAVRNEETHGIITKAFKGYNTYIKGKRGGGIYEEMYEVLMDNGLPMIIFPNGAYR